MKIFSSFDTNFRNEIIEREKERYWNDIFVISHGKFYYYFYIITPTVFLAVWALLYFLVLYYLASDIHWDWKTWVYVTWFILFFIIFIPAIFKLLKKYIDYILDFVVVTPKQLISYNQEWILSRKWRTVDVDKIKTITVNKDGLLRSLFNFWNIIILTEWDEQWTWEINFSFIDDPDNVKFKVLNIIEKD